MGLLTVPKQPIAGAEVTGSDITGTGTTILTSAIILPFATLPDLAEPPVIQVRFTHVLAAGAGLCQAYVTRRALTAFAPSTANANAAEFHTGVMYAVGTARDRTVVMTLPNLHMSSGWTGTDEVRLNVYATGSEATSEISVTNIRARFIYTPL